MMKSILLFFVACSAALVATSQWQNDLTSEWNGQGDFTDVYTCITHDDLGNIYLAGSTVRYGSNADYLVTRIKPDGSVDWRFVSDGPGHGPDEVKDIAFQNGKIWVTGFGNNVSVGDDFWTICFTAEGDSLWGNLHNDPTYNQYDQAVALALDQNDRVYVTGESDRDITGITNEDYLTICLDNTGTLVWSQRFNGIGNGIDRPVDIECDVNGNITVSGRSDNGVDDDIVTRQYSSSGTLQWTQTYDNGGTDRPADSDMDANGNIYIAGRRDNGTNDDFVVIKYNAGGVLQFTKFNDNVDDERAQCIDVEADGSFVVSGKSDVNPLAAVNWNYYTVKYNSAGTQQWAMTYNGATNNDDEALAVLLDAAGEVWVTGVSDHDATLAVENGITTIKYSSAGNALWTDVNLGNGGNCKAFDAMLNTDGSPWVAGFTESNTEKADAVAIQFSTSGTPASYSFNGVGDNTENARDLWVDATGQIYVLGYSVTKGNDRDVILIKFSPVGDTLWTRSITGSMYGSDDDGFDLKADASGNIVIAGYIKNSGTGSDILIQKYSPAGTVLWSLVHDGATHESDRAYALDIDASGNIYVAAKTDVDNQYTVNDEAYALKVSSNGVVLWSSTRLGGLAGNERNKLVKVSSAGSVFFAGRSWNGTNEDVLLMKYSAAGTKLWEVSWDGAGADDDVIQMIIDNNEHIYLTVRVQEALLSDFTDIAVVAFDASGNLLWSGMVESTPSVAEWPASAELDGNGGLHLIGSRDLDPSPTVNQDLLYALVNTANGDVSSFTWDVTGRDDVADHLALVGNTAIIAAHVNEGTVQDPNYDLYYAKIFEGQVISEMEMSVNDSIDVPNKLYTNGTSLWVVGSTWNQEEQRNILLQRYDNINSVFETEVSTATVYPNPTHGLIYLSSKYTAPLNASLCDVMGREVLNLGIAFSGVSSYDITDLPSGLYFLRMQNTNTSYSLPIIKN